MVAAAILLWGASSVVGFETRVHSARGGMNVLVIAVDTLRDDAVSLLDANENEYDLTPQLRKSFAPHATIFTRAHSQSAWTLPSFSSIFTGLYPEQHQAEFVWSRLGPEQLTLTELLRERGYMTMGVVSGHFTTREAGIGQGFVQYDQSALDEFMVSTAASVTDHALQFLKRRGRAPFFLFAHYFEPHFPYIEHREVKLLANKGRGTTRRQDRWQSTQSRQRMLQLAEGWVSDEHFLYREEVAYADSQIGRLLRYLDEHRLWDNTCVVFVADHGEEFYEHGGKLHGRTLFEEIIHVPLAIAMPGSHLPHVVTDPVETRWLFPTLLQVTGTPAPAGLALGPSLLTPHPHQAWPVYSATCAYGRGTDEGERGSPSWYSSFTSERYKLIDDRLNGETKLFDLQADPGEQHDLSRERPEVRDQLARALKATETKLGGKRIPHAAPHFNQREQRRLKDLGYL